jgi:hypothetical protein
MDRTVAQAARVDVLWRVRTGVRMNVRTNLLLPPVRVEDY